MQVQRFLRNTLLWIAPVAVVWFLLTPFYNRFLTTAGENLLLLQESPNVTNLMLQDGRDALVLRRDFPADKSLVYSLRVADIHFHLILLGVLFLAVPAVPWQQRLANLGWAVLILIFFHILLVFFWVKFAYATQLGEWSIENYPAYARETLGMTKHLMDLPFKLGLPLLLWAVFYLRLLLPGEQKAEGG